MKLISSAFLVAICFFLVIGTSAQEANAQSNPPARFQLIHAASDPILNGINITAGNGTTSAPLINTANLGASSPMQTSFGTGGGSVESFFIGQAILNFAYPNQTKPLATLQANLNRSDNIAIAIGIVPDRVSNFARNPNDVYPALRLLQIKILKIQHSTTFLKMEQWLVVNFQLQITLTLLLLITATTMLL